MSLTNLGSRSREIELTSYVEIALAPQAADVAHPAFQNLFVQTEFVPEIGDLGGHPPSEVHGRAPGLGRARLGARGPIRRGHPVRDRPCALPGPRAFRPQSGIGRGRAPALEHRRSGPRPGLQPPSTSPAGSRRHRPRDLLRPWSRESRDAVLDLADKYREPATFDRALTLAWTQAQVQLHHLGIETDDAHLYQRLANRIIYSDPSLRPSAGIMARNERGAPGLWARGISGDLPIVVVRIDGPDDIDLVRTLLRAHEYWRLKLLTVDLVIVNEQGVSYAQGLQEALETLVRTSQSAPGARRARRPRCRPHPSWRPAHAGRPDAAPDGCARRPAGTAGQPGRAGHPPGAARVGAFPSLPPSPARRLPGRRSSRPPRAPRS